MDKHLVRWLFYAIVGILLVGTGLCLTIEAAFQKHQNVETTQWVKAGTIGLVVFMSGLSVFGRAIIEKTHYERKQMRRNRSTKD
jgi:integral membrane sensor domain MASE1